METPVKFYNIQDVSSILLIRVDKLRDWIKRSFIEPHGYVPWKNTTRKSAVFTEEDLVKILLFQYLTCWGLSRKKAANMIKHHSSSFYENELILNKNTDDRTLLLITHWKQYMKSMFARLERGRLHGKRYGTFGYAKAVD